MRAIIPLHPSLLGDAPREIVRCGELTATLFRFRTGIEGLRIANARGEVVLLPWMGGMIWSASFDGVALGMRSGFDAPRAASSIAGTYGCLAFHAGLLRNGVPAPGDDHAAHGEFPCMTMDRAWLEVDGNSIAAISEVDHALGFGPHYRAMPSLTLAAGATLFDIGLGVENRSGKPMDLMYMCHINFDFVAGGRCLQPAPFTPERTAVRRAVPAHVRPDAAYQAFIDTLSREPQRMEVLSEPERYDPEQVFYLHGLGTDAEGQTHLMLLRPEGDAFAMSYAPECFPHTVRWILNDPDQKVAAFALPSTCQPEGYAAEKRKGHVRVLPPHGRAAFSVRTGYLDATSAPEQATRISKLS
ncbi:DUF4432 family protein [Pseudoroseomonas globiformis]|uniref:DUF4432 family protein n=1 Tax=Teichococcus globiformis TaxID=2307229 RepID=A0ABV7G7M7_9PROT